MARHGSNWDKRSREIREEEEACAKCEDEFPPSELEAHHRTHFPGDLQVPGWMIEPLCHECHKDVHRFTQSPGSRSNTLEKAISKVSGRIDDLVED